MYPAISFIYTDEMGEFLIMKFKNKMLITFTVLILLLSGCSKNNEEHNKSPKTDVESFINNFNDDHPGYELIDYLIATEYNSPIKVVVVALNKEKNSSAYLFFLFDNDDWGNVSLAEDNHAYYRTEDGLRLEKNVVFFSVDFETSYGEYEIHDFQITVSRINNGEPYGINYKSTETIRQNKGQ